MIAPRDAWSCYFSGHLIIWDGKDFWSLADLLNDHVANGDLSEKQATDLLLDAYKWSRKDGLDVSVPLLLSLFTVAMCFLLALFLRIILSWV